MTVCKTFASKTLNKGENYRKAELLENLQGHENMASTYFDPTRNELYTFFNQESKDWENEYDKQKGELYFSHRKLQTIDQAPKWEQAIDRHVFLHYRDQGKGEYKYLGMAKGESLRTNANGQVRVFVIQ